MNDIAKWSAIPCENISTSVFLGDENLNNTRVKRLADLMPFDYISCLDSLLGHSTEEFQALQLIIFAMFGAVEFNHLPHVSWSSF